nr:DUF421 domain-containing protein [Salirhabdus salicampi]
MFVFGTLRLMGKREIGELSILDLVIFIMVAEMAVISIDDLKRNFFMAVFPMVLLLGIQHFTAYLSLKNQKAREILDGKPSVIIHGGKLVEREMRKQRYNMDDLLTQLRDKGIQHVQEVELAILEANGKLSVFEKKNNPMLIYKPLIVDGKIQHEALEEAKKKEEWLRNQLKRQGYTDIRNISYCALNQNDTLHVDIIDEDE